MNQRSNVLVVALAAIALTTGCGDGGSTPAGPVAEQLASTLLTATEIDGEWTINTGSPDAPLSPSGVLTDDQRDELPTFDLCDNATPASRAAAEALRWKAFRQLDLDEPDPIDPPADRVGHMIFVQQFLTSGTQSEVTATFDLVRDGMQACLGDLPADEEGPGRAQVMKVPAVGDDRYGVLTTVEEAGGWAQWRLHNTIVRKGSVLMSLTVVDIHAGVAPRYTNEDIDRFTTLAVAKL